jgi:3-polyprenyl-4-hydroxybenzoate decarboxylase
VEELVDHHVGRLLDLFDIDADLVQRWQGVKSASQDQGGSCKAE